MKHIYIIISLFFLVGCERDPMLSNELVAARLIASMDDHTTGTTRVNNTLWGSLDRIGVSTGADYIEYKTNLLLSETASSVTLTPENANNTVYYPSDDSPLTFRAYCPYVELDDTDGNMLTYNFDGQSDFIRSQKVDLVYTNDVATGRKSAPTVNLTFQHQFCKVILILKRGYGISEKLNASTRKTSIKNIPTSATFDLSIGKLHEVSTSGNITEFYYLEPGAEKSTIAVIVPPHKGKGSGAEVEGKDFFPGRAIDFTLEASGINYSYPIPDYFEFNAGMVYTFEFTLTRTAPILESTVVRQWNSGAMAWDGDNKHFLTAPAEMLHYSEATKGNTIVIKTNHSGTPSIAYSTSETKIEGSLSDWLTEPSVSKTLDISPFEWTFTYDVTQKNTDTTDRVGYIHTTVGNMTVVTKVTQSKDAEVIPMGTLLGGNTNCFMVPPGTVITFPLTRLFDPVIQRELPPDPMLPYSMLPEKMAKPTSTFKVEKLWDDTEGRAVSGVWVGGVGKNAYVTVETGLFPGNALIAVRDREQDNVIVWSYHIWVTDYIPLASATFTNIWNENNNGKNFVFMDRNLGATAAGFGKLLSSDPPDNYGTGLFYQWGRKDPFPATELPGAIQEGGGSFTAVASDATTGTVPYTIKNPHVFLTRPSDANWLFDTSSNNLWGLTTKSIYDPCPIGWRVPKHKGTASEVSGNPWSGFVTAAHTTHLDLDGYPRGFQWGVNAAYPFTGSRAASTGKAEGGGTTFYWSATNYNSVKVIGFSIGFGVLSISNINSKTNGNPVRCVQE